MGRQGSVRYSQHALLCGSCILSTMSTLFSFATDLTMTGRKLPVRPRRPLREKASVYALQRSAHLPCHRKIGEHAVCVS